MKFHRRHAFLAIGALGLTGFVGGAWAVIAPGNAAFPAADGQFYACLDTQSRRIRMVDPTSSAHREECRTNEILISWNQIGPAGAAGVPGAAGPAGADGAAGPQGPAGLDGAAGPVGPVGPAGADGAQGLAGLDGAPGPAGASGVAGAVGPMGPMGPMGFAGPAGADGAAGLGGPSGPAGVDGAPGVQGPAGPQGSPGVADGAQTILNGNAAQAGNFNITGTGTMASAVVSGGQLRLGDQDLTAAALQTLVAGGNADALHTHAGAANPWVQVTTWATPLSDIVAVIGQYPLVQYQWGIQVDSSVLVEGPVQSSFTPVVPIVFSGLFYSPSGTPGFALKSDEFLADESTVDDLVANPVFVTAHSRSMYEPARRCADWSNRLFYVFWRKLANGTTERYDDGCGGLTFYVRRL